MDRNEIGCESVTWIVYFRMEYNCRILH